MKKCWLVLAVTVIPLMAVAVEPGEVFSNRIAERYRRNASVVEADLS